MEGIKEITDKNYKRFLGRKDGRIKALKMGAEWCAPCKQMDRDLPTIIKATPQVDWGICDIDDCEAISKKFDVMSIPVIIAFKNGNQYEEKHNGYSGANAVIKYINDLPLVAPKPKKIKKATEKKTTKKKTTKRRK